MKETNLPSPAVKTGNAVRILQEKVCREFGLTPEEVKAATITIKGSEVTIKKGK